MDEPLVSKRARRYVVISGEFSVIDVGNRLEVEVHRRVYRNEREHGHGVCEQSPLGATLLAIRSAEYRAQTLEEQHDHDP